MDFITALGRLLHDGQLRDAFATEPLGVVGQLGVRAEDCPALMAISVHDLEIQAKILVRKRFDLIKKIIPRTIDALGETSWPLFYNYARKCWPKELDPVLRDAAEFSSHITGEHREAICQIELNRLNFALSASRFSFHFVTYHDVEYRKRSGLQIFFRYDKKRWREAIIFLKL